MKTEWVVGFEIKTAYENGEIVISANREGMLSLTKHLMTLADGAFLVSSGNFESYMKKLHDAFNPATLENMMCRFQLSVAWDGTLYDCDFNQAAGMKVTTGETIFDIVDKPYEPRCIYFDKHCYACTAGAGSSCGGTTEA